LIICLLFFIAAEKSIFQIEKQIILGEEKCDFLKDFTVIIEAEQPSQEMKEQYLP
jgi:hypothetical protein